MIMSVHNNGPSRRYGSRCREFPGSGSRRPGSGTTLLTAAVWFVLCALLMSCDGRARTPTSPGGPILDASRSIVMVSGDSQTGAVGQALEPFVVLVTSSTGAPMAGADVLWSVIQGQGELLGERIQIDGQDGQATVSTTDPDGLAQVTLVVGAAGRLQVEAKTFFAAKSVRFSVLP